MVRGGGGINTPGAGRQGIAPSSVAVGWIVTITVLLLIITLLLLSLLLLSICYCICSCCISCWCSVITAATVALLYMFFFCCCYCCCCVYCICCFAIAAAASAGVFYCLLLTGFLEFACMKESSMSFRRSILPIRARSFSSSTCLSACVRVSGMRDKGQPKILVLACSYGEKRGTGGWLGG